MDEKRTVGRPRKVDSQGQIELDKMEKQFEKFDDQIKELTMDRMNAAPKADVEPQTKLSQRDAEKIKQIYLKPVKIIGCRDKFNENFRSMYEYDKEMVAFIAENKEVQGEAIELWTRPFGGMSAEMWRVPVNTPVWGPRYLAEQIKRKSYHRLSMQQTQVSQDSIGTMVGSMVVDNTIQRLDALPVSNRKSIFMGASGF